MKWLSSCVFGCTFAASTLCFGQIDIYQSDAYSLEEMCAREAEQTPADYTGAYEVCIEKNKDNPMYKHDDVEPENAGENTDGANQAEVSADQGEQEAYHGQANQ